VKRVCVVLNPSSRDFEAQRRWPELERVLSELGKIEVIETEADDGATRINIAAAVRDGGYERVIAIGGDGTVHLVVNALTEVGLERTHRLGIIPFGTANDVAKSLELPIRDPLQLARIAMSDHFAHFDVGRVRLRRENGFEERAFVDSVTVGMDADILSTRRKFRDLKGYLSYVPAIAERALEQQSMDVHLTVDGRSIDARVLNLIINNAPIYAGELRLPGSLADDGLLDLYLFDRLEYASKLLSFAIKQADLLELGVSDLLEDLTDNQRTYRGRKITVRLASPRSVQVDGEVFGKADEVESEVIAQLEVPVPDARRA
jgi:diacylglycerol kinase (ATP)